MRSTEQAIATLGEQANKHAYALETAMLEGGITSALEKAHFIAQVGHESSGFMRLSENLNYSADRLGAVFKKYFPTVESQRAFQYNPVMIANRVYANRIGNGNPDSGDGWKYRGRGFIQLTGKANYNEASKALFGDDRLVTQPDLATEPMIAARIAVWFWNKRNIRPLAMRDDIEAVTRKINGGTTGLDDRKDWLRRTKRAFEYET
jgi:putative chitinase